MIPEPLHFNGNELNNALLKVPALNIGGESQQRVSPCTTTSRMTAEGELEERRSEARLRESSRCTLTTLFPKIMRDLTTTLIMSLLKLTQRFIRIT
jgi:hypothetical protein